MNQEKQLAVLNAQQRAAVEPLQGVLLVCAGAGSGKTRVITHRIINLVTAYDVPPYAIVALTFTNKAAREMRERVVPLLAERETSPVVSTFHAYCLQLLKTNRHLLEVPEFTIMDEDDREKLIQKLVTAGGNHRKVTAQQVGSIVSHAKNAALSGSVDPYKIENELIRQLYLAYEEEKRRSHCFDFDDLLLETIRLFKRSKEFKTRYQGRIRHMLIDEYQDTNRVQHALLREMACDDTGAFALDSLCVVGDEDQSIYSWRGAHVSNIVDFAQDFPTTERITIEQNYRSAQHILEVANVVIGHNRMRHPKRLWSEKTGSDRVRIVQVRSDIQEGELVAHWIRSIKKRNPKATCAVLYRSHYQSRSLEEALIHCSLPYTIIGGIRFYERQEIKDLLAYLRLIVNPYDRIAFARVINTPARGLGAKFEELFNDLWSQEVLLPFTEIGKKLIAQELVTGTKQKSLEAFLSLFERCSVAMAPSAALEFILHETCYLSYLRDTFDVNIADEKTENIRELANAIATLEERGVVTINTFLEDVALLQETRETEEEKKSETAVLMTLHAAKGLEFDYVVLAGLEDGLFPSGRSVVDTFLLEEERRLLYVGITRARERLLITHAKQRRVYGRITEQLPSRFLKEVRAEKIRCDDCSVQHSSSFGAYFEAWFSGISAGASSGAPTRITPARLAWSNDPFEQIEQQEKTWRKYQTVVHPKFGTGIVEAIEAGADKTTLLTVRFSSGIKKIDARFLSQQE